MRTFVVAFLLVPLLFSCKNKERGTGENQKEPEPKKTEARAPEAGWEELRQSVVTFDSFDGTRILESGQGFFVTKNLIATRYSLVNKADNIVFSPLDSDEKFKCSKYVAVDRINDIILLKVDSMERAPVELFQGTAPNTAKTMYLSASSGKTLQLFTGQMLNMTTVQGTKLYRITNRIRKSTFGAPVFVSNRQAIGIAFSDVVSYEMQSFAIPSIYIVRLLEKQDEPVKTLESLRSFSNEEVAAANRKIKGLVLETDMGDITIRLFNQTPEYRDNFIRLVKENYYDSLLIHRVISNFGIQTGAADTRYAEEGDLVGWKGPGYTLPAHIVPGLYHKRGMIGSPRKPDTQNQRRRSDGSQFYIVTGRKYFDKELDEIEEENGYKFSSEQRQAYKTIGGAPHLDGTYTVFGEVISGMEVADQIVQVETDRQWRPLENIRLKRVRILN
ncbi:Peptidyl-prolyl cis-trans isomerase (rotamase)-cyclophilin family [Mariniphaga anaerophila]|uniref:peptidylprolyl isomerase n=1 Tax=Mariniphaga anaerophila TaxID=1484053 RepID=A0A1M5BPR4_9BACT|nr:peptidylprolyl isomerase [Mariniphaga anaerophila]SHF44405.1 Peptidyl-prolyl cis-trans isomerase (rotamase)-cyclophilin family [Mariniphaga anaerophila]